MKSVNVSSSRVLLLELLDQHQYNGTAPVKENPKEADAPSLGVDNAAKSLRSKAATGRMDRAEAKPATCNRILCCSQKKKQENETIIVMVFVCFDSLK